jgi:hypothetical protein
MRIVIALFKISCMILFFSFTVTISTFSYFSTELFAQEDHEHEHGHDSKPKTSALEGFKKKVERLPSLGRFAADLRNICSALEKDGRRAFFYEVALKNSEKDPKCLQCKDFFKLLTKACVDKNAQKKIKKSKKKSEKEEELKVEDEAPSPSPSPFSYAKQRYPNIEVLEAANQLGTKMASNQELVGGYYDLLNRFVSKLKESVQISPGLKDYLDHFEYSLFSAFNEYKNYLVSEDRKKKDKENAKTYKPEDSSEGIDLLFE